MNFSTLFSGKSEKFLRYQADRLKIHKISGHQAEIRTVIESLHGQLVAVAVEMAVAAKADAVLLEQREDFLADIAAIPGRIVEKTVYFSLSGSLEQVSSRISSRRKTFSS